MFTLDRAADAVEYAKGPAATDKEATTGNVCHAYFPIRAL
jgi:hypothetical protein